MFVGVFVGVNVGVKNEKKNGRSPARLPSPGRAILASLTEPHSYEPHYKTAASLRPFGLLSLTQKT